MYSSLMLIPCPLPLMSQSKNLNVFQRCSKQFRRTSISLSHTFPQLHRFRTFILQWDVHGGSTIPNTSSLRYSISQRHRWCASSTVQDSIESEAYSSQMLNIKTDYTMNKYQPHFKRFASNCSS